MTRHTRKVARALFAVLLLLELATLNMAQTTAPQTEKTEQLATAPKKGATQEPASELSQLEQLSTKVEQLEALIERQNQTLIEMQRQIEGVKREQLGANKPVTIQPI